MGMKAVCPLVDLSTQYRLNLLGVSAEIFLEVSGEEQLLPHPLSRTSGIQEAFIGDPFMPRTSF